MMPPRTIAHLLRTTTRGRRARNAAVVAGLGVGMLALGLSTVVGLGTTRSLQHHLDALFPAQRIVLRPATVEALMLQGDATTITPETVEKVSALRGVVRVSPEASVRFPLRAYGELLGENYGSDVSVTGIEGWLLGDEKPEHFTYDPDNDAETPAVLSYYFLDLYNSALAVANNLPKFSPDALIGRELTLALGVSSVHQEGKDGWMVPDREVTARIMSLTTNPDLLGLMVPLDVVESLNAWYGIEDKVYRALHVEMASAEAIEDIKPTIAAMSLQIRDRMAPWRKALVLVRLVGVAFIGLGVLVFALALAYLGSTFTWMLAERRQELALFQALGASPMQAMLIVAVEIGIVSVLGVAFGVGLAAGALEVVNAAYLDWRASRAFLPETLFAVPWWWLVLLATGCWALAVALGLRRVTHSMQVPISEALTRSG